MSLFRQELYKYLTRFNVILVALLAAVNLVAAAVTTGQYRRDRDTVRATVDALLAEYDADPELYRAYRKDYEERMDAWRYQHEEFENRLIDVPNYGERALFADTAPVVERIETYRRDIGRVLDSAVKRASDPEVTKDSYVYEYQAQLLIHYRPLCDLTIPAEGQFGWNEYFAMKIPVLLAAVAGIAVFSGVWLGEKRNRMMNVLRVSKYGGRRLTAVKLAAASCVSVVLTLLFVLTPLLSLWWTRGFSSLSQPAQALAAFEYCPYPLTVGALLGCRIAGQIVLFLLFDLLAVLLGQLLDHEIPVYAILLALLGVSFLVSGLGTASPLFDLKQFNFLDLAAGTLLFDRYRAVNLFGAHVGLIPLLGVLAVILGAALVVLPFFVGLRASRYRRLTLRLPTLRLRDKPSRPTPKTLSLLRYELGKLLGSPAPVILILAALALKTTLCVSTFAPPDGQYWDIYRGYIASLRGPVTEEKIARVREEARYILGSQAEYDEVVERYRAGEATEEELREAGERQNYARIVETPLQRIEERIDYLRGPGLAEYDKLEILDEWAVMKLVDAPVDFTLLFLFVVLFSDVSVRENRTGFYAILHIQKHGGRRTWAMKLAAVLIAAAGLFVLFAGTDVFWMLRSTDRTVFSAGLTSIPDMRPLGLNVSIGRYLVRFEAIRFAGALLAAAVIAALSGLTRKLVLQFVAAFFVVLAPPLLRSVDVALPDAVCAAALLTPRDPAAALPALGIWAAAALSLAFLSDRMWKRGAMQ